ncbi:MAG: hypothetical protein KDB27_13320 [Planctomycetales bacterium]|nr:hypothetical protein [Planctomycetales bacterium]
MASRSHDEINTKTGNWGRNAPLEPADEWFLEGLTPGQARADTDGDGLPDDWENLHNMDPANPSDAATIVPKGASPDDRHEGYAFLEFYINELADDSISLARLNGSRR